MSLVRNMPTKEAKEMDERRGASIKQNLTN